MAYKAPPGLCLNPLASGPWHVLFSLHRMLFPNTSVWLSLFQVRQDSEFHFIRDVFPEHSQFKDNLPPLPPGTRQLGYNDLFSHCTYHHSTNTFIHIYLWLSAHSPLEYKPQEDRNMCSLFISRAWDYGTQ